MKTTSTITIINTTTAIVTKKFQKQAMIYGTEEYRMMKAFMIENPNIKIAVRKIKKNSEKETNKNMTYDNMIKYILTRDDAKKLLKEMKMIKEQSTIYPSPYRYVLAWFKQKFENELEESKNMMDQFSKKNKEEDEFDYFFEETSENDTVEYQA